VSVLQLKAAKRSLTLTLSIPEIVQLMVGSIDMVLMPQQPGADELAVHYSHATALLLYVRLPILWLYEILRREQARHGLLWVHLLQRRENMLYNRQFHWRIADTVLSTY